jgi:RND family efflux transporter MFP subunit
MKLLKKFRFTKKRVIILAIVLAVVFGAFFSFRGRSSKDVEKALVEKGTVREELILTGSIRAEKHVTLSFPTSGKISWVGVTEGQKVSKGQALTSLDKTVLNTVYQQALNTYKDKQAAAEKAEDDVKNHSSDETFTQKSTRTAAQVARDSAYDSVLAAAYNLKNATLLAPFAGIVTSLPFPSPGVNVNSIDTQVEIVDPDTLYFEVEADQSEVTDVRDGQEAIVILDSYSDKEFKGKVSFVSYTPKAGEAGTIYKVKVEFEKGAFGGDLPRIGMTGDAKFVISQKENVLYAPPKFINTDKEGKFVNLGKIGNKVRVKIGIEGEEKVEITDGVSEGNELYD